jgi:hypothetical protein
VSGGGAMKRFNVGYTLGLDVGEMENVVSAGRSLVTPISTVLYCTYLHTACVEVCCTANTTAYAL